MDELLTDRVENLLPGEDFSGRVSLRGMNALPEVGKNYDLVLLEEGKILSVFGGGRGIGTGAPLAALGFGAETETAFSRFLRESGRMAAFPLTGTRGYAVAYGLKDFPGWGMAVLPYAPGASVERVMAQSFDNFVSADFSSADLSRRMRQDDCATYELLGCITSLWRRILTLPVDTATPACRMRFVWKQISLLTGAEPLSVTECDSLQETRRCNLPAQAAGFCLLCLGVGLYRAFPKTYRKAAVSLFADGCLQISLPAGNRTRLPAEWEAAARLAQICNMRLSLTRRRNALQADFAPAQYAGKQMEAVHL